MNTKLALLGAFVLIIVGFILVKPPTPPIVIAAEPIIDLGGYTITNTILSFWVILILMSGMVFFLYRRLRNLEEAIVPSGMQNVVEALLDAFFNVVSLVAGEKNGRRFFPVVAGIFVILLFANWFGLFPWNNIVGRTVDLRFEHLEVIEEDSEDILHDLNVLNASGKLTVAELNEVFGELYFDPIPFDVAHLDEADEQIAGILGGKLSAREVAVRELFAEDPIPADSENVLKALEERLEAIVAEHPFGEEQLEGIHAHGSAEATEKAIVFNLPLPLAEVTESELKGPVVNGGGVNIIPIKAEDFEFDPYHERLVLAFSSEGAVIKDSARVFDTKGDVDDENPAPSGSEQQIEAVTLNLTHLGLMLKMTAEGVDGNEGVAHIFPFFRAIATDLNLPLAIALWSFIFVQLWGIQSLGVRSNFGKYIGAGSAAVVKGPIGVVVGFLEIISEISRIVSFTFRLFGNIFAGEIVLFMSAFLVPFAITTVFYGLEVFVGFIQAFVFAMLTLVFAVTAISHGEHEEEFEGEGEH